MTDAPRKTRRCPYCAEEIYQEAKFCRYCNRQVKGHLAKQIIKLVIILMVLVVIVYYRFYIFRFLNSVELFFKDLGVIWQALIDTMRNLPERMDEKRQAMDAIQKVFTQNK